MKKREATREGMRASGQRVRPGDEGNPDSFKVRRGKIGGYRDYFTPDSSARSTPWSRTGSTRCFGYSGD